MTATMTPTARIDMKLEVVVIGVSDVGRAKAFYEGIGWRPDADFAAGDDFRVVQLTPHNSAASVIFGKGVTSPKPGSARSLVLAVDDLDAARADLIARGVAVSEVFHFAGGPFNDAGEGPRVAGRDPQGRSYYSFASFEDPDGNGWLLQEIRARLPGREWEPARRGTRTSPPSRSCSARRPSTTAASRRRTPSTTGGTGTRPTWGRARTAAVRRRQPPPPTATWRQSFTSFPDDPVRVTMLVAALGINPPWT